MLGYSVGGMLAGALVLSAALLSSSCSLLFEPSAPQGDEVDAAIDTGDGGVFTNPLRCEGSKKYSIGSRLSSDRQNYSHIDFEHGTLVTWFSLAEGAEGVQSIVNLGGLRVVLEKQEQKDRWSVRVNLIGPETQAEATIEGTVSLPPGMHGLSLRWDALNPLSGINAARHIELRMTEGFSAATSEQGWPSMEALDFSDSMDGSDIELGSEDGKLNIHELVVYGRPLFEPTATTQASYVDRVLGEGGIDEVSNYADGGFDVRFAYGCRPDRDNAGENSWAKPEAWTWMGERNQSRFINFSEDFSHGMASQMVYRGQGGRLSSTDQSHTVSFYTDSLSQGASYAVSLLAHSTGNFGPKLTVWMNGANGREELSPPLVGGPGTRDDPRRYIAVFDVPVGVTVAYIEVSLNKNDGEIYMHSLELRENLIQQADFESGVDLTDSDASRDGVDWDYEPDNGREARMELYGSVNNSYAGTSICAGENIPPDGWTEPSVMKREAHALEQESIYLVGGAFGRSDGVPGGVRGRHSSFFALGQSYNAPNKIVARGYHPYDWRLIGTAGRYRRRLDCMGADLGEGCRPEDNYDDSIRFGAVDNQSSEVINTCFDNVFVMAVEELPLLN